MPSARSSIALWALVVGSAHAAAPDGGPSLPAAPLCTGQRADDAAARALREENETGAFRGADFYRFATQRWGAPVRCALSWTGPEGQRAGSVVYRFKGKGLELAIKHLAPEATVIQLDVPAGLDEKAARGFLEPMALRAGFAIDWAHPDEEPGALAGDLRRTFWDPTPGLNTGVELRYRKGLLIGLGIHSAM